MRFLSPIQVIGRTFGGLSQVEMVIIGFVVNPMKRLNVRDEYDQITKSEVQVQ